MASSNELQFIPVVGYEGLYDVSSAGDVRSIGMQTPAGFRKGRVLKQAMSGGYPLVTLCKDGKKTSLWVHQIVCRAFHGAAPSPSHEVAHEDGVRAHVWEANLRWSTRKANHADKVVHGTNLVGDRHHQTKIPDNLVQLIAAEYVKGSHTHGLKALAKKYAVSVQPIYDIVTGERQVAHG